MSETMRVMIVDDEAPAREGLRLRLRNEPDVTVKLTPDGQQRFRDMRKEVAENHGQLGVALDDRLLALSTPPPGDLDPVFNTMLANATRICHSVEVARVRRAEIQPEWPLGRPGSRTSSQPSLRPARPSTGSTVLVRVSGRRAGTASIRSPWVLGARRARWVPSRTTSACEAGAAASASAGSAPTALTIAIATRPAATLRRTPRGAAWRGGGVIP